MDLAAPTIDRKEAILNAMLKLIVERGFHNAPMSLLAKRSGASPGVIYYYFPSKDDVIHALYWRVRAAKREAFLSGYTSGMAPRQAFLLIWLNAYRFYRSHVDETRFLDQYLNSPFCGATGPDETEETADVLKLFRTRKKGGILKDLPVEALHSLSLGLAASLAKAPRTFSPAALKKIAETVWAAIAHE
jgi:TetR/AcrR family transcriptional regulator, repressor of fatR-cypB operon